MDGRDKCSFICPVDQLRRLSSVELSPSPDQSDHIPFRFSTRGLRSHIPPSPPTPSPGLPAPVRTRVSLRPRCPSVPAWVLASDEAAAGGPAGLDMWTAVAGPSRPGPTDDTLQIVDFVHAKSQEPSITPLGMTPPIKSSP